MLQRHNDFGDVDADFVFGKFLPLIKMREELTAANLRVAKQKRPRMRGFSRTREIKVDNKKKRTFSR
jgi:hypothetical protein